MRVEYQRSCCQAHSRPVCRKEYCGERPGYGFRDPAIYSMLNEKSKNPGVVSIKKICDGLEISIRDFFDSELFDDLEQEIQ